MDILRSICTSSFQLVLRRLDPELHKPTPTALDTSPVGRGDPEPGASGSFNTAELHEAARAWLDDPARATAKYGNISGWNTSLVTSMAQLFDGAGSFVADLSGWSVDRVTDMYQMFRGARLFKGEGLSHWNVGQVTDMSQMFKGAQSFNTSLAGWDVSKVTNMRGIFAGARSFKGNGLLRWDVGNVVDMHGMFFGASSFCGNLSLWAVGNVIEMGVMFLGASAFRGVSDFIVGLILQSWRNRSCVSQYAKVGRNGS